ESLFRFPDQEPTRVVEIEDRDQGTPDGRSADQPVVGPFEMVFPAILPGVEQGHFLSGFGIDSREPVRFFQVAAGAGPRQVVQVTGTTGGAGDDVLDVKRCALQRLVHAAILTALAGPGLHGTHALGPGDAHWGLRPRRRSAWARKRVMRSLNSTRASSS